MADPWGKKCSGILTRQLSLSVWSKLRATTPTRRRSAWRTGAFVHILIIKRIYADSCRCQGRNLIFSENNFACADNERVTRQLRADQRKYRFRRRCPRTPRTALPGLFETRRSRHRYEHRQSSCCCEWPAGDLTFDDPGCGGRDPRLPVVPMVLLGASPKPCFEQNEHPDFWRICGILGKFVFVKYPVDTRGNRRCPRPRAKADDQGGCNETCYFSLG